MVIVALIDVMLMVFSPIHFVMHEPVTPRYDVALHDAAQNVMDDCDVIFLPVRVHEYMSLICLDDVLFQHVVRILIVMIVMSVLLIRVQIHQQQVQVVAIQIIRMHVMMEAFVRVEMCVVEEVVKIELVIPALHLTDVMM